MAQAESFLTRQIAAKGSSVAVVLLNQELEDVAQRGFSFSRDLPKKEEDRLVAAWQEEIRHNSMPPQIREEEEEEDAATTDTAQNQNALSAFVFARVGTLSRNIDHAQKRVETWTRVSTFSRNMDYMRAQASSIIPGLD